MRILDRYILIELVKSLVIISISAIFLFLIFDFSMNAGKFSRAGANLDEIADYYARYIPYLFTDSLPMILLLSLFWSMNRLNRNREIIAMQASGMSVLRICMPLLIAGLILAIMNFTVEEEVNTKNSKIISTFVERIKGQRRGDTLEKQYFFTDVNSSLLYYPEFDPETMSMRGTIRWECFGVDESRKMLIFADSGEYFDDSWWLYGVKIIKFENGAEIAIAHKYKRRPMFEWDFRPSELQRSKDFGELRISRLRKRIAKYYSLQPEMSRNMSIELHNRFAQPLMNIVALLLSIPFAFRVKGAKSVLSGIGISFLLVFTYYGVYTVSIILGKHGVFSPFIIWTPNVIFSGLSILLFRLHR